jgi:ubiquinol-cytochrome c reductase iron-sulfur subunit
MSIEPSSLDSLSDARNRRDLPLITTAATGAMAERARLIPLVDQMNPDPSTIAAGGPVDLNLGVVDPGVK